MKIKTKASRLINNAGLKIKKHSPEILMVAGIAGTVASTVMACKATTKLDTILNEKRETVELIHKGMKDGEIESVEYTEDDGKKDLTIVYTQTGVKILKLYGPAIILGMVSITSIVAGHRILKKRNLALAAAYAVVDKGFKNYRKNVVDRFGEELDKELRYGIKAKDVEEVVLDKKGNEKVEKRTSKVIDEESVSKYSEYARFFDETCGAYEKDPEYNLMFLRKQQEWANELLKSRGHVFLNEVYDMLGIPRTKSGQIVGWVYNSNDEYSDNYIDFGVYDGGERSRAFVNGYEKAILLDFNVDGVIYDLI